MDEDECRPSDYSSHAGVLPNVLHGIYTASDTLVLLWVVLRGHARSEHEYSVAVERGSLATKRGNDFLGSTVHSNRLQ